MAAVLGIDLGGTRVKAGLVEGDQIQSVIVRNLTSADKSENGIVDFLASTVDAVLGQAKVGRDTIDGLGIGVAGIIRFSDGVVRASPNFPAWHDFPIGQHLTSRIGMPVSLDNDANVVTLGEARFGAGRGVGDFICLTLGSGVGGGLFLNGGIYRGADGMAGELGHIVVEPEGFPCGCGGRGCLEQYASANGLRNMLRRDNPEAKLDDPALPTKLFESALAGNARCIAYFREFGYRLAIGLGGLLNSLNVHRVVLAGGVARANPMFLPILLEQLPRRTFAAIFEHTQVVPCELWENGGILGAAALVEP